MSTHATELGATLLAWRDRLTPAAAGLPSGRARRARGMRREELAELAGISVDYVVRLEQGRSTTPSAQVVAALVRALQLTSTERDHLYRLAGLVPPAAGEISDHIPPGVRRVLNRLGDAAVAVFAADWQLMALVTTITDPAEASAQTLAEADHQRQDHETGNDQVKTHLRGPQVNLAGRDGASVLAGQTPLEPAMQEIKNPASGMFMSMPSATNVSAS